MRNLRELDRLRDHKREAFIWGIPAFDYRPHAGCFIVPHAPTNRDLLVIASSARISGAQGWDHVSVSLPNRCPNWSEMDFVKRAFFLPHEVCFQLHPAESDNISNHPFCLHIWQNVDAPCPLPPAIFVGHQALGELDRHNPMPVALALAIIDRAQAR